MKKYIFAAGILALSASQAMADRPPNQAETALIKSALSDLGYVSWSEINYDNVGPKWEIDDARKADGSRWDLKLSVDDLKVFEADREDY